MDKAERKTRIVAGSNVKLKRKALSETDARLKVLQETIVAVHSTLNLKEVFKQITDSAVYSMDYTTAVIMVLNEEKKRLEIRSVSTKHKLLPQIEKLLGFSLNNFTLTFDKHINAVSDAIISGRTIVAPSLADIGYPLISKGISQAVQKLTGTKNAILMPMMFEDRTIGTIFVTSPREEVTEEELTMVRSFAVVAAQAITNAELYTQSIQVKEALRTSESKFKNLYEHAKDAVFIADAKTGILLDVNEAGCDMLGLP